MEKRLLAMLTDESVEFLQWSLRDCDLIGTTYALSREGEIHALVRPKDKSRGEPFFLCLPKKRSGYKPCVYGSVRHYSLELQRRMPDNRGKRDPFYWSERIARRVERWLYRRFGVCSPDYKCIINKLAA